MRLALAFFCLAYLVTGEEDYYTLLGVPRTATDAQIKKSFKKLSLQYHPDRNKDNLEEAQKKFMKITNAYETLSDSEKRSYYDWNGEKGVSDFEQTRAQNRGYEEMYSDYFKSQKQVYASLYTDTDVVELDMNNLNRFYGRKLIWIVNFYHPNCSHCVEYKDEWISIATKLQGIIVIASVNCSSEEEFCEEHEINEYPTLLFFPENTAAPHEVYNGERSYTGISNFAVSRMQNFVVHVNNENYQDFINRDSSIMKILLFTSRKTTPPLFRVLSKEYKGQVIFGEIRSSEEELVRNFKVTEFPSIFALTSLEDPEVYTGANTRPELESWVIQVKSKEVAKPLYKELTRSLYKQGSCNKRDTNICVVLFQGQSPGAELEVLKELASDYEQDPVDFYWSNKDKYQEFYELFGKVKAIVYKPKRKKYIQVNDLSALRDILPNVVSGGGTFETLVFYPEFTEVKTELCLDN